jgi:hypothetical protein
MLAVFLCASASLQPATAGVQTRRALLGNAMAAASFAAAPAFALEQLMVDPNSLKKADIGLLDEIPPKAKQAYLQYLPQLQLDADFYLFELKDWLNNPGRWDRIGELTASSDIGSAASAKNISICLRPSPSISKADRPTKCTKRSTACAGQISPPVQRRTESPSSRTASDPHSGQRCGNA